jgi:hypothetical protein
MKALAIDCIESMNPLSTSVYTDCIKWLKSLKHRYTPWLPTLEQAEALSDTIREFGLEGDKHLTELKEQINQIVYVGVAHIQKQWRPSEEQMKALAGALSLAKNCGEESAFDLRTLYEQLKNL